MIPALISPTDGSIYVDGMEVTDTSADIAALRKKIGFIFQYPEQQLFAKNVYEDVVFGPRNVGISEVEAEKRAYEAIQLSGCRRMSMICRWISCRVGRSGVQPLRRHRHEAGGAHPR